MSSPEVYLVAVALLFGTFSLASVLQAAASWQSFWQDRRLIKRLKILELSGVLAVLLTCLGFGAGLSQLWQATDWLILLAALTWLLNLASGFVAYRPKNQLLALRTFSVTALLTPLCLSLVGIYLLTGQQFWHTSVGLILAPASVFGLVSVGLTLLDRYHRKAGSPLVEQLYLVWLVALGSVLPLAIRHSASLLNRGAIEILMILSLLAICLVFLRYSFGWRRSWLMAPLLLLATPILLAWANLPYIISGQLTLDKAYGAQAFSTIFLIAAAVILPLLLVGFWLFYKLLLENRQAK